MSRTKFSLAAVAVFVIGLGVVLQPWKHGQAAASSERIRVTGEIMDTWCYVSGVMGAAEATLGSAHHTCAIWCAAGGIPVGLLAEDGEVYMVLQLEGEGTADGSPTFLDLQSEVVTAEGDVYLRDGLKYLVVENILTNEGINPTHEDYGLTPGFAIPDNEKTRILEGE